jgi:hypothetical protein
MMQKEHATERSQSKGEDKRSDTRMEMSEPQGSSISDEFAQIGEFGFHSFKDLLPL